MKQITYCLLTAVFLLGVFLCGLVDVATAQPRAPGATHPRTPPPRPPGTPYGTPREGTPAINPTTIAFTASADHNAIASGQSVLTDYAVYYVLASSGATVASEGIGKPPANPEGQIAVPISDTGRGAMVNDTDYYVIINARGPGGITSGSPSNLFRFQAIAPVVPAPAPVSSTVVR